MPLPNEADDLVQLPRFFLKTNPDTLKKGAFVTIWDMGEKNYYSNLYLCSVVVRCQPNKKNNSNKK